MERGTSERWDGHCPKAGVSVARCGSSSLEYDEYDEQVDGYDHDEQEQEEEIELPRPLGQFMSPQLPRISQLPRLSLGVGADTGPRRVRVVAPWKVNEIQVPPVKDEEGSNHSTSGAQPLAPPRSPTKREKLTDDERQVRWPPCSLKIC